MDTNEINSCLKSYSKYIGTFARDKLPIINSRPSALIVNTDTTGMPGEHWVAIYVGHRHCEYFDSFGLPPLHTEIISFLNKYSNYKLWSHNDVTFQSVSSTSCGMFCIVYVKLKLLGYTLNVIKAFLCTKQLELNDLIVKALHNSI